MSTKRENIACRPGTKDAMQRLADENERLKVEIGIVRGKNHCQSELLNQYTDENEALRAERYELAALVEDLKRACRLGIDMMIANDCDLPITFETMRKSMDRSPAQSLAHIRAAGAREALERAMADTGFSGTVVRVDLMRDIIEQMEGE